MINTLKNILPTNKCTIKSVHNYLQLSTTNFTTVTSYGEPIYNDHAFYLLSCGCTSACGEIRNVRVVSRLIENNQMKSQNC